MKVVHLNLVFLIASEINEVYSSSPLGSETPGVARQPSRFSRFRPWSSTNRPAPASGYPCDKTKVNNGAPEAHAVCHTKCLAIQSEIRDFHKTYPDHSTVTFLYNKCGLATEGRCDYWRLGLHPICYCHTPDGMRGKLKTPLFMCRLGIPIMRKLTGRVDEKASKKQDNENINDTILSTELSKVRKSGTIVDGEEGKREPEEKDDEPTGGQQSFESEDELLVIDLNVMDTIQPGVTTKKVQAIVDTGSVVTLIHQKLAKFISPLNKKRGFRGASNVKFQIFGRTTLHVRSDEGIVFSLEGFVTNYHFDIVIGNDFNLSHGININIPEMSMSFVFAFTRLKMTLKFIPISDLISMIGTNSEAISPLIVSARVNRYKTKIIIDTGASRSFVNKAFVKSKNIRQSNNKIFINDETKVDAAGETDVTVMIAGTEFTEPALVVPFKLPFNLILGNIFIKQYVELIDFKQKIVTFKPFSNNAWTSTPMFGP